MRRPADGIGTRGICVKQAASRSWRREGAAVRPEVNDAMTEAGFSSAKPVCPGRPAPLPKIKGTPPIRGGAAPAHEKIRLIDTPAF
jgi:hypothetical protein